MFILAVVVAVCIIDFVCCRRSKTVFGVVCFYLKCVCCVVVVGWLVGCYALNFNLKYFLAEVVWIFFCCFKNI